MPQLRTIAELQDWGKGKLPDSLGFEVITAASGKLAAKLTIRDRHLAPNGYLHAASIIALADTAAGYGTMFDLPESCAGFTTVELKANFLGTCLSGVVSCEAVRRHSGRTTQVWDVEVRSENSGKVLALFRCTQMLLPQGSRVPEGS